MRLVLPLCLLLSGCATVPPLASLSIRTKTYSSETKVKKDVAFKRTQEWFAKTFQDSKRVVQLTDQATGKIIGNANADCDFLNEGRTHSMHELITFTITTEVMDNKLKVTFEDVQSMSVDGQWKTQKPANQEQADRIFKECTEPLKNSILDYVSA